MKWSGGPVVAKAVVQGFRQIEQCTPSTLRDTVYGYQLYDVEAYWRALYPLFFGMTIYLQSEEWLPSPVDIHLGQQRESWVVISSPEMVTRVFGESECEPEPSRVTVRRRSSISMSQRFEVFRRDGFTCVYCGRRPPHVELHVDHVRPVSKGGTNDLSNLRTACNECNLGKGATLISSTHT